MEDTTIKITTDEDVGTTLLKTRVVIRDVETGEVLCDKSNAIHPENFSLAWARCLANDHILVSPYTPTGPIEKMYFGTGASTVNPVSGRITYLPTNILGSNATLYNKTYEKIIDPRSPSYTDTDTTNNRIDVFHTSGNQYSDLVVTCTLDFSEPSGQELLDNTQDTEGTYVFDELGLVDYTGNLLTHIIFSPVQKSLNRKIQVIYTIRLHLF